MNEEWVGLNRVPRLPNVLDGFEYPKPVKALIKKMDSAFDEWAEADTALAVAEEDLNEAKARDTRELVETVLAGREDLGEVHVAPAERAVKRAQILADARRVEVNKIGREVEEAIRLHAREITLTALSMAREGLAERERLLLEAAQLANEANEARTRGLAGLREISNFTRGVYQFDPSFPVTGQATFPNTREERIHKICDDLEELISHGVLFPVSEPEVLEATA